MNLNLFIHEETQNYVGLRNKLYLTFGYVCSFLLKNRKKLIKIVTFI